MKYILKEQELSEAELANFLQKVEEFRKSRAVKRHGLQHRIATYQIVLKGNMYICDDDINRVIKRAKEYFDYQKTDFTIYIHDQYLIYEAIKKERK